LAEFLRLASVVPRSPTFVSAMLAQEVMDEQQAEAAIAEARRRWGACGAISVADQFSHARLLVGELRGSRFFIRGRGSTWPAAFADAEARDAHASRRMSWR